YHLSGMPLALAPLSVNPRTLGEQPSVVRLFDISARKVYPSVLLPSQSVVSYSTFSPLPPVLRRRLFSVALSVSRWCGTPPVRWCAALRCPDFPPLLSPRR